MENISTKTVCPNIDSSFTTKIQKHVPCSFGYIVVGIDSRYYRQPNAVDVFIECLQNEVVWIENILSKIEPAVLSSEGFIIRLSVQTCCQICKLELKEGDKCLDHCHVTGNVRGYACSLCNLFININIIFQYFSII